MKQVDFDDYDQESPYTGGDIEKSNTEALVQRQLDAYNKRDLDSFCACIHPSVQVHLMVSDQLICNGMVDFKTRYGDLFKTNPNLHCELKSRIVTDTVVIDEEFVTGSSRSPEGMHAVAIYGFRDDLIARVWFPR